MKDLGKRIRLLRQEKGWNQSEMAKKLDISVPAFSKIESGMTDINLSRLEQIASIFELTAVGLLTFDDLKQPDNAYAESQLLLREKDEQVIELQQKVIELYSELRSIRSSDAAG